MRTSLLDAGDCGGSGEDGLTSSVPASAAKNEEGENDGLSLFDVILLKMRENEAEASSWKELKRSIDGLDGCGDCV